MGISARALAGAVPRAKPSTRPVPPRGFALGEAIASAFESIRANRLRSALTMLGIVIGIGSVILIETLGASASAEVEQRLHSLGTNLITITPGSARASGLATAGAGSLQTLTEADVAAISDQVDGLSGVSPIISGSAQLVYGGANWATHVYGEYPIEQTIANWQIAAGSFFTDDDEQAQRREAVLGSTVADNLFGDGTPGSADPAAAVGQTIRIGKVPFTVEGVLAPKGPDQDDVVLIPFTTARQRLFPQTYVNQIVVQAQQAGQMAAIQNEITEVLREQHHTASGTDDFTVLNVNALLHTAQGVTGTLTLLLSAVAAVSLLVGGIGIMNIMLVSVTERTREIGIRAAIGARPGDIRRQFMIEATALSAAGGLAGLLLGVIASFALTHANGWPAIISPEAILLSLGFAGAVGIFFGYYPALKASRLDPVEALRFE